MDLRAYRKAFPETRDVNVGTIAKPIIFTIDSMSTFGLMKNIWALGKTGDSSEQTVVVGRVISSRGDELFEMWGPEAIVNPKIYRSLADAEEAGHEVGVPAEDRGFFLTSEIRPTTIWKLLNACINDGGGGQAAAKFPEVGDSGRTGPDVA